MSGSIGILNVGAGDTKLVFDPNNAIETIRAKRIVKDMLRRGYALIVEVPQAPPERGWPEGKPPPKRYQRVLDFDEKTAEYIIADLDPEIAAKADREEAGREEVGSEEARQAEAPGAEAAPAREPLKPADKRARRRSTRRVPAHATTGTAVARSAGG